MTSSPNLKRLPAFSALQSQYARMRWLAFAGAVAFMPLARITSGIGRFSDAAFKGLVAHPIERDFDEGEMRRWLDGMDEIMASIHAADMRQISAVSLASWGGLIVAMVLSFGGLFTAIHLVSSTEDFSGAVVFAAVVAFLAWCAAKIWAEKRLARLADHSIAKLLAAADGLPSEFELVVRN